jgi:general secretion pathway protein D
MATVQALVRQFFLTLGVDLNPPKTLFFNDREGTLLVHATLADLDLIEAGVQVLDIEPPQVNIKTRFVEVSQNDTRALGFDWYFGNFLMNHGALGLQGGSAPAFNGSPTRANPTGVFPSQPLNPTANQEVVTSGLRNTLGSQVGAAKIPELATLSGILTDPQFRVVLRALEQRDGADLLNEASVTTVSGRQTQIQVVDLQTIVIGTSLNQTGAGGTGTLGAVGGTAGGVIGSTLNYPTITLPFGPTLDVIPYVAADGFTIDLTLIPSYTEFLGYDDPGAFVPQAQSASSGVGGVATPLVGTLPLPHFRVRQVTTTVVVWDGQTVALGGLIAENVTKLKDKVPVLGDLPFVGRLFRSESSQSLKKNLMIFVTPTIIDPAGNRQHSEDEMPFAQTGIPVQKPAVPTAQ